MRLLSLSRWPLRRSGRMCPRARRGSYIIVSFALAVVERHITSLQCWSVLIPAADEQRHAEWSRHYALLPLGTLAESQRKIAYALCAALDGQRLRVVESM